MNRHATLRIGLVMLAAVGLGCGGPRHPPAAPPPPPSTGAAAPGPTPIGAQVPALGISAVPRLRPAPTAQDQRVAADLVSQAGDRAGARADFASASWAEVDPVRPTGSGGLAKLLAAVRAPAPGTVQLLTLKVLDTTVRTTPADLAGAAFDSTQLESRFHGLIDALAPAIAGRVRYLSIGNEVDVYLGAHPAVWDSYGRFYADAVAYVHRALPGVAVGVTTTFDGARGASADRVARLNQDSDVLVLTYYPLGPAFVPRPPSTAGADIAQMTRIAGSRPLVLQEVGYPSAGRLSSSEQAQAAFVTAVLAAWHSAGARIPMLNWFALGDFTEELCAQLGSYYSLPGEENFAAYLCSLGLRRVDGTAKPAWDAMLAAAPG